MATIVVGYLDTPEGHAALQRGIEEATLRSARLVVVNSSRHGPATVADAVDVDEFLEDARSRLDGLGIAYEVRGLVRGMEAADDVVDVAHDEGADLIVIGLRRRSPVGKLIMGSNAQRILLDADCPVLAVKAEAE